MTGHPSASEKACHSEEFIQHRHYATRKEAKRDSFEGSSHHID